MQYGKLQTYCPGCKNMVDEDQVSTNRRCRSCNAAYAKTRYRQNPKKHISAARQWRERNPERFKEINKQSRARHQDRYKNGQLLYEYGITLEEYDQMLEDQDGVCAICRCPPTYERNGKVLALHVDHDHKTGEVRGLLCHTCNLGLGRFKDNPALLRDAAQYLEKHQ